MKQMQLNMASLITLAMVLVPFASKESLKEKVQKLRRGEYLLNYDASLSLHFENGKFYELAYDNDDVCIWGKPRKWQGVLQELRNDFWK